MLNPSTADANKDDPTIHRVISFAKSWGYGGVYVGNLFAFCSTDPKGLKYVTDPIGKNNIQYIQTMVVLVDKIIYAWGNNQKEPKWLSELVPTPYCIDISKKGVPKHPLYLNLKFIIILQMLVNWETFILYCYFRVYVCISVINIYLEDTMLVRISAGLACL